MLSIQDLNRMKNEFLECYEKIFDNAYNHLQKALLLKLNAIRNCQD